MSNSIHSTDYASTRSKDTTFMNFYTKLLDQELIDNRSLLEENGGKREGKSKKGKKKWGNVKISLEEKESMLKKWVDTEKQEKSKSDFESWKNLIFGCLTRVREYEEVLEKGEPA